MGGLSRKDRIRCNLDPRMAGAKAIDAPAGGPYGPAPWCRPRKPPRKPL